MRKTLAVLLTLTMVLCMIPSAAFAETAAPVVLTADNVSVDSAVYNGSAQTPAVKVTVGNVTLTEGTDYTVAYADNTNAGTASVTVTGAGNYSGVVTKNFAIVPLPIAKADIVLTSGNDVYNTDLNEKGDELADLSKVKVTYGALDLTGMVTLTSDVISSNTKVRITAVANNANLTGSTYNDFTIKYTMGGKDFSVSEIRSTVYTGEEIEPSPTVKGLKNGRVTTLKKDTDYELSYLNNVDVGVGTVIVTGKGNYTGTMTQTFEITERSISASGVTYVVGNAAYNNGSRITPNIVIYDDGKLLVEDSDYYVVCNSKDLGAAEATVYGMGNYTGSKTVRFTIVEKTFDDSEIEIRIGTDPAEEYAAKYTGKPIEPTVNVRLNGSALSSSNYSVAYTDNVKVGTANIIITGEGKYAGQATATFSIVENSIRNATVTGINAKYEYTGKAIEPKVVVKVDGVTLTEKKDYTVSYRYNTDVTSDNNFAIVAITAVDGSGYIGTCTRYFDIIGKDIADCKFKIEGGNTAVYTGRNIYPEVTVEDDGLALKQNRDYEIRYKDADGYKVYNINEAGTYKIVVNGIGNYSGTKELSYVVSGNEIDRFTVKLEKSSVKATGYSQVPVIESVSYRDAELDSAYYSVSYENSKGEKVTSIVAPGTYKVIVTGKNGYTGSTYARFEVIGLDQEITIEKTAYKVYVDSDSFQIKATATGDGTGFTYVSSDPTVASVNSKGVVTIHKLGRAKITVTTDGNEKYTPVSDEVFVKVHPDKSLLSRKPWTEGKTGSFRVRWYIQEDTTTYQIRYSTTSDFKSYKTKTVKASELYDTQSTRISGLESGTKYYVKVRAVKSVYNDYGKELKYYGKWSNWKSVVTK